MKLKRLTISLSLLMAVTMLLSTFAPAGFPVREAVSAFTEGGLAVNAMIRCASATEGGGGGDSATI